MVGTGKPRGNVSKKKLLEWIFVHGSHSSLGHVFVFALGMKKNFQ